MPLHKRRVFAGVVLEQEVYNVAANTKHIKEAEPKPPPFQTEEQRQRHVLNTSRKRFERIVNANFDPQSFYVTYTLDKDNYVDNFKDADRILTNAIRRLRYICPAVKIVAVMGRGKKTGRIHFHLVVAHADERAIRDSWRAGKVARIEHLRAHNFYDSVDCGQDYKGLAGYLFDHWPRDKAERGNGKRWKQTRNLQQPDKEKPELARQQYSASKPPKAPKGYQLTEYYHTDYGYQCFRYTRIPQAQERKTPMKC